MSPFEYRLGQYFDRLDRLESYSGHSTINPIAALSEPDSRKSGEHSKGRDKVLSFGVGRGWRYLNKAYLSLIADSEADAVLLRMRYGTMMKDGSNIPMERRARLLGMSRSGFYAKAKSVAGELELLERNVAGSDMT